MHNTAAAVRSRNMEHDAALSRLVLMLVARSACRVVRPTFSAACWCCCTTLPRCGSGAGAVGIG